MAFEPAALRAQFPFLATSVGGRPVAYLDSAATSQQPQPVLDAVAAASAVSANVHRSQHPLSEAATQAYEDTRETVRGFLNAEHAEEIVVTRGTTEAINLVARSFGALLSPGDRILVTRLEHHSNLIPWLQVAVEREARVSWIDVDEKGLPRMDQLETELTAGGVRIVAVTGQSNVIGTRPDLRAIADRAHRAGAAMLVDAAQLAAHAPIDVRAIDCDFLAFSGHKVYGPTGVGVLYGKRALLEKMPPFLGGGMMLDDISDTGFTSAALPAKFEAGTPPSAAFVGLAAAIRWLTAMPIADREAHERALIARAIELLRAVPGVRLLGPADPALASGCLSFVADGAHPHDVAHLLGDLGFCLRAGHHCAKPLHRALGADASVRLSVAAFNTIEEIDDCGRALITVLQRLKGG